MSLSTDTLNRQRIESIRNLLSVEPGESATAVIAALARQGLTASPALVQEVRREMAIESAERAEATRPPLAASNPPREAPRDAAQEFIDAAGGLAAARALLGDWERRHSAKE